MDLASFRSAVDNCPEGIAKCHDDLVELYRYVGLPEGSAYQRNKVWEELHKKIKNSFVSGHQAVWRKCKQLRDELIQNEVLEDETPDPYISVLDHLQDAIRSDGPATEEIIGDWNEAILHANDSRKILDLGSAITRGKVSARTYEVAKAAKRLRTAGYGLVRKGEQIYIEPESETRLVARIENLVLTIGGFNVARRIFNAITPAYDETQERYHLVKSSSPTGQGAPQIPFGYLLLLAEKHVAGSATLRNTDEMWAFLCTIAKDYAAVLDVQTYNQHLWGSMDAAGLLIYLRELGLYDTLFRIPQMRGRDVVKLAGGVLDGLEVDKKYGSGWTISDALEVIAALLEISGKTRGSIALRVRDIKRARPKLSSDTISRIFEEVLSHPIAGANQGFSKPTDAPPYIRGAPGAVDKGHDFFLRPLLQNDGKSYFFLDRSVCAPACVEALLMPLRGAIGNFEDGQVGPAIERFLQREFLSHGISTLTGKYSVDKEDGECDLVIETAQTIIFFEIKKKSLTRQAKAGSDAFVLLDLAGSLLKAQVQAGWHEVRLRRKGVLELESNGVKTLLELKGREIERIAVSLFDFGSFQDRVLLKQFLEATLRADFSASDASLKGRFDAINKSLAELRAQLNELAHGAPTVSQPFFHCWFLSVPQLLVLLDDVQGEEDFRKALWDTRHFTTGSSDFYFDLSWIRKAMVQAPSVPTMMRQSPPGSLPLRAEVKTSDGYAPYQ